MQRQGRGYGGDARGGGERERGPYQGRGAPGGSPYGGGRGGGPGYSSAPEVEQVGIVCAFRDVFGFLQPLALTEGTLSEEHVYFPEREITYRDMKLGDEVFYGARATPKGPQAVNLRAIDPATKVASGVVCGVVVREFDSHRNIPGVIQVVAEGGPAQFVVFMGEDCSAAGQQQQQRGGTVSRAALPRKADEVELVVLRVPDTNYARAQNVKCIKSAREKQMSEQVKRMVDAGAQREQGIIETVKSAENYGFIKPADRTGHIYFRFEDFDQEVREAGAIKESVEVEFFVVAENNKGKMTDRAVHIKVLAPGTVVLESTVAVKTTGMVVVEPKISPREEPGRVLLDTPVRREGLPDIDHVELWPRCVPDGLLFRVGDRLELDVQNYRPEKINFARSVRVLAFRKLGREVGRVHVLKKDQAFKFGFLRSNQRENDIYFRQCEVLGPNGTEFVPEANVTLNIAVSFETVPDESRAGAGSRVKAVRCRLVSDTPNVVSVSQLEGGVGGVSLGDTNAPTLLKKNCTGVVVRDSNKRDAPGLIRPIASAAGADGADGQAIRDVSVLMYRSELIEAIEEFSAATGWKEASSEGLTASKRKALHALLDEKYPGVAHETLALKSGSFKKFRMWKLEPAEYAAWKASRPPLAEDEDDESPSTSSSPSSPRNAAKGGAADDADGVTFVRSDSSEEFGTLSKDLQVSYDLYFDPVSNKKVAKNVKLTDEELPGETSEQIGVMCCVFSRGGKYGFIRVVPTDEKLFWNTSSLARGTDEAALAENMEVGFSLRRRGGLRVAVGVRIIASSESRAAETRLAGVCTGLVVEERGELMVLPFDVTQVPLLSRKFWNTDRIKELLSGSGTSSGNSSSSSSGSNSEDNAAGSVNATFLPVMSRSAVPIEPSELEAAKATLAAGDLVECVCVANWVRQRGPVKVCSLVKLPSPSLGPRRKGTILRLNARLRTYGGEHFEYSEIRDDSIPGSEQQAFFYCESHEIRPYFESAVRDCQQGDEVEFYALPALRLALHTQVVPKMQEVNGIVFNKGRINTTLKQAQVKSGHKGIVMAKGPAEDGSIGFVAGWRDTPAIHDLPWAHLLQPAEAAPSS